MGIVWGVVEDSIWIEMLFRRSVARCFSWMVGKRRGPSVLGGPFCCQVSNLLWPLFRDETLTRRKKMRKIFQYQSREDAGG